MSTTAERLGLRVPEPPGPMRVIREWPPDWIRTQAAGLGATVNTIFTYGDLIYAPAANPIPWYTLRHEEVHRRQQGADPDAWWVRYFAEPSFRLEQELQAYRREYAEFVRVETYPIARKLFLAEIARHLTTRNVGISATDAAHRICGDKR
jgi:hypothetical protein